MRFKFLLSLFPLFLFILVITASSSTDVGEDSSSDDATGIAKEIAKIIKSLQAKKFALSEYPKPATILAHTIAPLESIDTSSDASEMPSYLKLYRTHLKDLKKIKWGPLIDVLRGNLGSEHVRAIFKEFTRGWITIMNKSIEAEVKALQAENKEIPEEVANQSALELARKNFGILFKDISELVKYLLMVPLKYSEEIVYEVMCTLKSIIEMVLSKVPEMKDANDKPALTAEQIKELKMCLKMAEAMRKKTGPITIQLWFWLLIALTIVTLIMLAIFTFYYLRR